MDEHLDLIHKLFATYATANVNPQTVTVYLEFIGHPANELRAVIDQCIEQCTFLPKIAEIKEKHRALSGALNVQAAADAWLSVQQAIRGVGMWDAPKFRNEITARAVEAMGWQNLCLSTEPGVDRAQFERFYNSMLNRQTELDRLLPASRAMLEQSQVNKLFLGVAERMQIEKPKPEPECETEDEECPF